MITAGLVKELRTKTGAGMMDCKKVLTETNGDMDKAIELLKERGVLKAAKKSDRIAAEGMIAIHISDDKKTGAIIEVNSETDFVAKNEDFKNFVNALAKQVSINKPKDVEALLVEKYIDDANKTVNEVLVDKIATIGENLSIRRFVVYTSENLIESYIHGDGKIGVLVNLVKGGSDVAKDVAMQIAAVNPKYLNREEVPLDVVNAEMELLKTQAINDGKPEVIAEKIVQGRISKFYTEICLIEQDFVKDPDKKVKDVLKDADAGIVEFVRFEKGEGIEKKEEDFATEVMNQLK